MDRKLTLLGLIIILFCSQIFTEEIKPKIKLVYGKWGDKPEEFGIDLEGDELISCYGPNDFYVDDKGFIYVLDNVNERVQVFDKNGKFVRIDKEMYEKAVEKGETRVLISPTGSKSEYYSGLLLKEPFEFIIMTKRYKQIVIKEVANGKKRYVERIITEEIYPDKKKYIWEEKKETEDGKTIYSTTITLPSGKKVSFSGKKRCFCAIWLGGEDKFGNLYIGFSPDSGRKYIKISPDGKIIGAIIIRFPPIFHYSTGKTSYISPRGDLYIMGSDDKGFWIDCYPAELFDKPEGRDFTYIYPKEEKEEKWKIKQLALRLAKTTAGKVRDSAIKYLGRRKIKEAIPILKNYLKEDKAPIKLKKICLDALRKINTEKAIKIIEKYGLNSKNWEIKMKAAHLLINTPLEKKTIRAIKEIKNTIDQKQLSYEKAKEILHFAADSLKNAKDEEIKKEAIDMMEKYGLCSENLKIRIEAAELLINTPFEKKAIEVVKNMAKQKRLPYNIAKRILYFGNYLKNSAKNEETRKEAIDIWIELLRDPRISWEVETYYLVEVTGKEFGGVPQGIISKKELEEYINKWKKWWEENKDSFKFPEKEYD